VTPACDFCGHADPARLTLGEDETADFLALVHDPVAESVRDAAPPIPGRLLSEPELTVLFPDAMAQLTRSPARRCIDEEACLGRYRAVHPQPAPEPVAATAPADPVAGLLEAALAGWQDAERRAARLPAAPWSPPAPPAPRRPAQSRSPWRRSRRPQLTSPMAVARRQARRRSGR
jgi:hypothetical protein